MDDHIITPLPFYDSTDKQSWNRERCEGSRRFCIYTDKDHLPPFQIRRTHSGNTPIESVYIVDGDGNETDITSYFTTGSDQINGSRVTSTYDFYATASVSDSIGRAQKTTTGSTQYVNFHNNASDLSVTDGKQYYVGFPGTFGEYGSSTYPLPDVFLGTTDSSNISNVIVPSDGSKHIVLIATLSSVVAKLFFRSDSADHADFTTNQDSGTSESEIQLYTMTIDIKEFTSYDYIYYEGDTLASSLTPGEYYIKLNDSANTWYSERFCVCNDVDERIVLEWGHSNDIDDIYYADGFENKVVFAERNDLVKPVYEPTKVGTTRDGYFFTEKVVTKKGYKLVFCAPEYMADAMALLPSHDTIYLTDKDGNREQVDDVNVSISPTSNCYFMIELEFIFDPILSGNCNTNIS